MANWKGIVGQGFRADEFASYVKTLTLGSWKPSFVVVHNTSEPRLSQWHTHAGEERMKNLESYYRDNQGWSAGPHLFIADDLIWAFTPLTTAGVHSPSWNSISWGVEMVGEYEEESLNPGVWANTVDALAVLHTFGNLDPATIRFHKEDPKTTHQECPGKNVSKPDLIAAVQQRMQSGLSGGAPQEHQPDDNYLSIGAAVRAAAAAPTPPAAGGANTFTHIVATEFGGGSEAGMSSAYGGAVDPDQPQVALPCKIHDSTMRHVRVFSRSGDGKSVVCLVNDVGPWNTRDDYWNGSGRPKAEAQYRNQSAADNGQVPTNDAGIDLTPAVMDALGVSGGVNSRTTVVDWEFA